MRTLLSGIGVAVALLGAISNAHGQKETERYIPIGQSPGLSQKHTSIGEISHVDPAARTVTVTEQAGRRTLKITDKTRIWLDRTKLKQTNRSGGFADLQKGRRVEVKYEDPARRDVAEWVKVEVDR
ncbi:MAG: hypothetical protein ACREUP_05305 [Burkholderiales bacterium]